MALRPGVGARGSGGQSKVWPPWTPQSGEGYDGGYREVGSGGEGDRDD